MATKKKLLEAAAGAAGGGGEAAHGVFFAEETLYDEVGAGDPGSWMYSAGAITGAGDRGQFMCSFWVYPSPNCSGQIIRFGGPQTSPTYNSYMYFNISGQKLRVRGENNAGSVQLDLQNIPVTSGIWNHVLISFDLGDSSKRDVYVNRQDVSSFASLSVTGTSTHAVAYQQMIINNGYTDYWAAQGGSYGAYHIVFDDNYHQVTSAFLAKFVDENMQPTDGTAIEAENFKVFLKMESVDTASTNSGTYSGGFTEAYSTGSGYGTGSLPSAFASMADPRVVYGTSGRANGQYLYNNSYTSVTVGDASDFTMSFKVFPIDNSSFQYLIDFRNGTGQCLYAYFYNGSLVFQNENSSGTQVFEVNLRTDSGGGGELLYNAWNTVTLSVQRNNTSSKRLRLNGTDQKSRIISGPGNYNIAFRDFGVSSLYCSNANGGNLSQSYLADLWINNEYIDLDSDDPFWDSENNKPANLGDEGTIGGTKTPRYFFPLRGGTLRTMYGTQTASTVSWTNLSYSSGITYGRSNTPQGYDLTEYGLEKEGTMTKTGSNLGLTDGKTLTFMYSWRMHTSGTMSTHEIHNSGGTIISKIFHEGAQVDIEFTNTSGSNVLRLIQKETSSGPTWDSNTWYTLLMSVDLTTSAKRHVYLWKNGELNSASNTSGGSNWATYVNQNIGWSAMYDYDIFIGNGGSTGSGQWYMGHYYLSQDYIDLSDAANRAKFMNPDGSPKFLGDDGSGPTGNQPLTYFRFRPGEATGTNLGSIGNFTSSGTKPYRVQAIGQYPPNIY